MRKIFPGYFVPTEAEFDDLWRTATFAFDASVLLGLYRVTTESRELLFSVLEKLGDRIFLPHQAALEYLRNRLAAVDDRSAAITLYRKEAEELYNRFQSKAEEHDIPRVHQILDALRKAKEVIAECVQQALKDEPDLIRSDHILTKLNELFDEKTGLAPKVTEREERCKRGADRYARKVPPGYEDNKKDEPSRYGDFLIWCELLDRAQSKKKPIVFVTRDLKADWWVRHRGETLAPRPELVQEMHEHATVRFYMYTTDRFLEYAQRFFNLLPDATKKAASEFKELEKEEKKSSLNVSRDFEGYGLEWISPTHRFSIADYQVSSSESALPSNWSLLTGPLFGVDAALIMFNNTVFATSNGRWKTEVTATGTTPDNFRWCSLKFHAVSRPLPFSRSLDVYLSTDGAGERYWKAILDKIAHGLETSQLSGTLDLRLASDQGLKFDFPLDASE